MGVVPPLPTSSPPSAAPTTQFDKIVDEVDEKVADIIEDVGETIEKILGTIFPNKTGLPDFLDGAVRTQARHELVRRRTQAEELVRKRIVQDMPALAPKHLAPHLHAGPQCQVLIRHPIP